MGTSYLIKEETLQNIADSIRQKTDEPAQIAVSDFADKILKIEAGADVSGTVNNLISVHNTATDSHSDIREAINNKLNSSELSSAINTALNQAKESGEFDGADGEDGISVTVKSVSESTEDGGSNVVTFSDGEKLTVKNGKTGADGYTPVKGIDYFTEADKEEFLSDIEAVRYVDQNLTDAQKEQTRKNIAAVGCLIGSSTEIAPSQVRQAILSGENVTISYIDDTFGTFFFSDFTYSEAANTLLCSAIVDYGESLLSATIYGNLEMDAWILSTNEISLKSDIPSAVNEALAQAKANGEFDGKDGTSVTVSKVTESTADGGSNVVTFSDGMTVTIKNGSKGSAGTNGKDGKTPVKGVDYWTAADQESVVQDVIAALGTPVFGRVDADNNIILTGELTDGIYTIKYEDAEGEQTAIGTLNHTVVPEPTYTNLFDPNTASLNTRMSGSSKAPKNENGYVMTASIPITATQVTSSAVSAFIAVPKSMWSGSANMFLGMGEYTTQGMCGLDATIDVVVGDFVKIPLRNQWGNSFTCDSIILSLYVKGSAIAASDIQNIEIYFNEIPE